MTLSRRIKQYDKSIKRHRAGRNSREWLHKVDVEDLLEVLEISNVQQATSDELLFSCPYPGHSSGDSRPSAYINDGSKDKDKTTVWKCHGCGRAGNAITFYAEHQGISKQQAALDLRERYAPNFRAPINGMRAEFEKWLKERDDRMSEEPNQPLAIIPDELYERLFGVDWFDADENYTGLERPEPEVAYLFDRGFTASTLDYWNIGYDEISSRLTIPVLDEYGDIVGVKGRTYKSKNEEKIKYRILGDKEGRRKRYGFKPYEKSRVVFGLFEAAVTLKKEAVLVEGELDVIALWQEGITAVSTGSAHLSDEQAILIRDNLDAVIVMFDIKENDPNTAAIRATVGYFDDDDDEFHPGIVQKLDPFLKVKVVDNHDDDASQMIQDGRQDELRQLIEDAIPSHELDLPSVV